MNNSIAVILILLSFGLFFFYANPTYQGETGAPQSANKSVKELLKEQEDYREALAKSKEIELTQTGLITQYNGISEEDKERLLKLLPDHIDSVRLIIDINNIAAQYAMSLKNIDVVEGDAGESAQGGTIGPSEALSGKVAFAFSLSGTYDKFRSFLRDLEQSLRLIDVASVAFGGGKEEEYDYQVTIHTYRLK